MVYSDATMDDVPTALASASRAPHPAPPRHPQLLIVDDNRDLALQFGIKSIPMILFFKDGEIKDKVVGLMPKDTLAQKLKALI